MELDIETRAMKFASGAAIGGRYDEETGHFDGGMWDVDERHGYKRISDVRFLEALQRIRDKYAGDVVLPELIRTDPLPPARNPIGQTSEDYILENQGIKVKVRFVVKGETGKIANDGTIELSSINERGDVRGFARSIGLLEES